VTSRRRCPSGVDGGILPGVLRRKDRYAKAFDYSSCHTGYTGEVVVEQSDGSKACVREPGGDQCYWVEKNNLAKIR
jgi:hypothetical protein